MRTVTRKQLDKAAISGSKVTKLTPDKKEIPDLSPQVNTLSNRVDLLCGMIEMIKVDYLPGVEGQRKDLDDLKSKMLSLIDTIDDIKKPRAVQIIRGAHGYLSAVSIGGKTYKFNRDQSGKVSTIDIIGR